MGIALLSIVDLLTPLQTLASRWISTKNPSHLGFAGLRYVGVRPSCSGRQPPPTRAGVPAPSRPVRVVRLIDAQQLHPHPGRLVISGRMADVGADLDRLVALEDADTSPRPAQLH